MTENNSRRIQVLVVDDHPIVRKGFANLINNEPDLQICGEAEDISQALRVAREAEPDLAIIDLALKAGNGLEVIKALKSHNPNIKMLAASALDESLFAERALRAGAQGFISKNEAIENLIGAIRAVLAENIYLSPKMTQRLLHHVSGRGLTIESSPVERLTDRELEVFQLLGEGLSTRQIAAKIHLSPKTIDRYRDNIKQKLQLKNATELIRQATQWVLENR